MNIQSVIVCSIVVFLALKASGQEKLHDSWLNGERVQSTGLNHIGRLGDCFLEDCYTYIGFAKSKSRNKYYFFINVQNVTGVSKLSGDVYLYTNRGTRIRCIDRGFNFNRIENSIQTAWGIYYLTQSEAYILNRDGLNELHFTIKYLDTYFPYTFKF